MERHGIPVGTDRPRRTLTPGGEVVRRPLIDDPELEALRAADRARDVALNPLGEQGKRRLRIYVLGACVFFPLANYVFTPSGFGGLWLQLLVAIAYGTFVALRRPGVAMCALVTVFAGLLIQAYNGVTGAVTSNFYILLAMILYGTAGALIGFRENDKQLDR